jgi:HTH-type transcriptional regulator, global nitrogen regulator NrpRI
MDINTKRKILAILKVLQRNNKPMGSAAISECLGEWGIDLQERMIRNYLSLTDDAGLTVNLGRRGRIITKTGQKELEIGVAIDKVGFVATRVDELTYRMKFDEEALTGTIILNVSILARDSFRRALADIILAVKAKLGMGQYLRIFEPGETIHDMLVQPGQVAVGTLCSVTLNGVLLRNGISMMSRFGGLLEMNEWIPVRFSQIINYDGSTLDPIETFIKGKMTSVRQAALTGTGTIGASFREIPAVTLEATQKILQRLESIGLGSVLMVGKPNQPLLDIPVGYGRVGIIVAGGLNPLAAVEETGIATQNQAMHNICDFKQMQTIEAVQQKYL